MQWIDSFYSPFPSLVLSLSLLAVVSLVTWRGTGRKVALAICVVLTTRYILWRALYTLNLEDNLSIGISLTLFLAEFYGFTQLLLSTFQSWSPTDRQSPEIETYPTVDIMVTVVDEPLYILKRTLIGCLYQDYPKDRLKIYVLDDGQRSEVKALATELGISYRTRSDRAHAKAGNLNEAMKRSSGEIIAVFDVDHVPMQDFLKKTVGFFADEDVAIVQTAQDFYNQDIFQRSVAPGRSLYNEQALFFKTLQAGRDHHNSSFFAGSSGLLRRKALDEIGGFQTATITEDLHTSLILHAAGYKSCYLNESLAFGLMPVGLEALALTPMGWGIEVVISVAETVASWPGAVTLVPAMPTFSLAAIALGGLWLCLWRRRWRYLGLAGIVAGMAAPLLVQPPDLLIDGQGRLLAVRTETGSVAFSSLRRASFKRKTWLRRMGQDQARAEWPERGTSRDGRLSCDLQGCLYRVGNRTVALTFAEGALAEDCWVADVVVSIVPVRRACPAKNVVDRFDLWRQGGHAFWLEETGVRIESVNGSRGDRPWVLKPSRKPKRTPGKT